MTTIGYINKDRGVDNIKELQVMMKNLDCDIICLDTYTEGEDRIRWRYILEDIEDGDTLVIVSFSNAVTTLVELTILLRMCANRNIRLVSLDDRVDTNLEIFQTSAGDLYQVLNFFGEQTYKVNRHKKRKNTNPTRVVKRLMERHQRAMKERDAVNLYVSGETIDTILKRCGILSHTTVFRILQKYGIRTDRHVAPQCRATPKATQQNT